MRFWGVLGKIELDFVFRVSISFDLAYQNAKLFWMQIVKRSHLAQPKEEM